MKMTNLFEKDLKRIANQAFNRQLDGKDLATLAKYLLEKKITDLNYDIVEELPNFIPPRKLVLHDSLLYRGAQENEFHNVTYGSPIEIGSAEVFANSMGAVVHLDNPNIERPDFLVVTWVGSVEPLNAQNNDLWFDV